MEELTFTEYVILGLVAIIIVLIFVGEPAKDRCFKDGGSEYSHKTGCVFKNGK